MWALSSGRATSCLSLFLAAQVLSSCFFVAHSQAPKDVNISIVLIPELPMVGDSVTLIPETTERDVTSCLWLRSFGSEYFRIFLHEIKPDDKVLKGDGYDGRQFLEQYCSIRISKLDVEDMALYMIIKNTTMGTETGEIFLRVLQNNKVVTPTPGPLEIKPKAIPVGTIVGVIVGCLVGAILVGGLIKYHTMKKPESLSSGESRTPHSASKPGSQQRLSIHNLAPIPAPQ